jgi:hypothetical protein
MEKKIVPVLAGVIAYLDTNHNLSLLHTTRDDPSLQWLQQVGL